LIQLRDQHPALRHGDLTWVDLGETARAAAHSIVAFRRKYEGQTLHVAVNLGHQPRGFTQADFFRGKTLYGSAPEGQTLDAFTAVVVQP